LAGFFNRFAKSWPEFGRDPKSHPRQWGAL